MTHSPADMHAKIGFVKGSRVLSGSVLVALALAISGLLFSGAAAAHELDVDRSLPVPALAFDPAGNLIITASPTSSVHDFDYLVGRWKLSNRKLKCRLQGCTEWSAVFESLVDMQPVLAGRGNIDRYHEQVNGKAFDGLAVRLFDPDTRLWSIYWADGSRGSFDPPVVGSFDHGIGHFFAKDTYKGRSIVVVFRWDVRNPARPVWSQAFSADNGKTWEWNSINVSVRMP